MATLVLTSATVLAGTAWTGTGPGAGNPTVSGTISSSTDWSDHVKQVAVDLSVASVDFTNFGSGGYMESKPGMKDVDLTITFYNDFAASSIDATFGAGIATDTLWYIDLKPTSSARSTSNPSYVGRFFIVKYPPLGAQVGGSAETQVGFKSCGKYARLTS